MTIIERLDSKEKNSQEPNTQIQLLKVEVLEDILMFDEHWSSMHVYVWHV